MILRKLILALTLPVLLTTFITAQNIAYRDVKTKVPGKTTVTFFDLVKKVFPDARVDEKQKDTIHAVNSIPLRAFFGQPLEKYCHDTTGQLNIGLDEMRQTVNGPEKLIWLLINPMHTNEQLCDDSSILAAFSIHENTAELIDAAEVRLYNFTTFYDPDVERYRYEKMIIAPNRQAVVVYDRTGTMTGTDTYSVIGINQKGFSLLLRFDLLRDGRCSKFITESARINVMKASTAGSRDLEIIVTTEKGSGDEYDHIAWRRHYRYVFKWQPKTQKYKAIINPDKIRLAVHKNYDPCKGSY